MEKSLLRLLAFDSAVVLLVLTVFLYGPMGEPGFFLSVSWLMFVLLLISSALTLAYILRRRRLTAPVMIFIAVAVFGILLSFFNWLAGGIIALLSLVFLLLSPAVMGEREIMIAYGGFMLLALLPPIETYFGIAPSFLDYVIIGAGLALIVVGILMAYRRIEIPLMLGFVFLSQAFLFVAPFHEIFGIHSNGTFGIYDTTIIVLASLTFFIFLFSLLEYDIRIAQLQEKIRKGYEYIEKGEYRKAEGLFRILYRKARNEEILNGLSIALMRGGKFKEAEKILRKLVSRYPSEVYLTNLGNLYYRKGEIRKAMLLYGKVLKENPNSYNALNNLARCYMELGEYEKARKLLERAIKISPEKEVAQMNYRTLKEKIGSGA